MGKYIASWGDEGFVRVADIDSGIIKSTSWKTRLEVGRCHETVAFAPNHRWSGDHNSNHNCEFTTTVAFAFNNDHVRLWNFVTGIQRILPQSDDPNHSYRGDYITSLAYCPQGQYFVVGCHVASLKFWRLIPFQYATDSPTNEETRNQHNHDQDSHNNSFGHEYQYEKTLRLGPGWSAVTLLQFTPDSQYIACTSAGANIRLIHVDSGMLVTSLAPPHQHYTAQIQSLCFSPDGKILASGACDRSIRLWDIAPLFRD